MRYLLLATIVLFSGPALAEDKHADHMTELEGFRAIHAWSRATSGDEALVFMELENTGAEPVVLIGAETEIAGGAGLVGIKLKNGEATYTTLPPLPVAPGREMHLDPDALAIRLTGLTRTLVKGDEFEMHIETSLGELELHVEIEAADAKQHSHAGHQH